MNQVFISYSRSDKEWLARLLKHLKPVLRREPTAIWWDGQIMDGQRWRTEIDKALESANVGVLLISANFLHSDFIAHNELPYLLGKAKECGIKLLAVLLSNCLYDEVGLAEIQFINSTSKPLDRCRGGNLNEALVSICKAIRNEIDAGKLKQDPEVTLKKEDVSLDKLPANPALGEPRLVGRIKGLVTSPKFVPDQGQSSNLPADMPYTMVIAFLEISNVGMPSIANDFRMVVIFKNGARIATKLNMMDSAK